MNESIAILANDPSKKLLFDFLSNDQPGKLISSALSFNTFPEHDAIEPNQQPAQEPVGGKAAKDITRKMFMGIDEVTTLSEDTVKEVKVKKQKKSTVISKDELFTDFLVDLFCVDSNSNSSNPFV